MPAPRRPRRDADCGQLCATAVPRPLRLFDRHSRPTPTDGTAGPRIDSAAPPRPPAFVRDPPRDQCGSVSAQQYRVTVTRTNRPTRRSSHRASGATRRRPTALSRDDVAHLAHLARLELTDAGAGSVCRAAGGHPGRRRHRDRLAAADIEPTTSRGPADQRVPGGRRPAGPDPRGGAGRRAGRRAGSVPGAADPGRRAVSRVTELTRMTAESLGRARSPAVSSAPRRSPALTWTGSTPSTGPCTRSCTCPPSRRCPRPGPSTGPGRRGSPRLTAGRGAAGAEGHRGADGGSGHRRLQDPGGLDPAVRRDRDHPAAGRGRGHPGKDQPGRVRDGLVDRELRVRPDP